MQFHLPTFATSDVAVCRDYILKETGTHRFEVGGRNQFSSFAHRAASAGKLSLNAMHLECRDGFRVKKEDKAPYFAFQFILDGICHLESNVETVRATRGDIFVLDPEQVCQEYWPDNCEQFIIRVPIEELESSLFDAIGYSLPARVKFKSIYRDPGIGAWLSHYYQSLDSPATGGNRLLDDRRVSNSIGQSLLMMILTGLDHSGSSDMGRSEPSLAPYYVKRVEQFFRENFANDISQEEIASASGVSIRTVFYGFQRWRGTTPMCFLRDLRLDMARAELCRSRGGSASVSQAALSAGFTNFSQFSKLYRARFGEKPSSTLMQHRQ